MPKFLALLSISFFKIPTIMTIPTYLKLSIASFVLFLASSQACAEIVVIVSAKNPVTTLSAEQVSDIFLGKVWIFPSGMRAVPVDQAEGARARDAFYLKITGKSPAQIYSYWSKIIFTGKAQPPKEVADGVAVRKLVSQSVDMIGYIDKGLMDETVKMILSLPGNPDV